jgi:quercetin dioxygenase-like cupin family protein
MPLIRAAEVCLPSTDLAADLAFYTERLGFRLDTIYPADDPAVAVISGHGVRIRLDRGAQVPPAVLRLLCDDPEVVANGQRDIMAPGGVRILIVAADEPMRVPPTAHAFSVCRLAEHTPWVIGRAGMSYGDLVPGRLGGSVIASHIRIPQAGPVPDMVHYHSVGFQLIFCYRGWVRLVYEDQGPPFVLGAGDAVIQPPRIRHRVLESSEGLEVVEVSVPAEHVTTIDHDMTLPTPTTNPLREFDGQRFCLSRAADAVWRPWRIAGFTARGTGIGEATRGVASVTVARPTGEAVGAVTSHTADILFSFVLSGRLTLRAEGHEAHVLEPGDAVVIPPQLRTALSDCSADLTLLEVSLPAAFDTVHHRGA